MDDLTKTIIERGDLAHLALFLWAKGAEFSREAGKGRETRATLLSEFEYRLADLRLSLAARRFSLALDDMVRKYRPDQPRAPKGTPEGGRWVFDAGSPQQERPTKVRPRRLLVWMPTGFTKHGINQAINRGVSASDISDALNNPIRVTAGSSPYSWK